MSADPSPLVGSVAVVVSYLAGTMPTALWVAGRRGVDPTRVGSGNPGATNVMRTVGKGAGAVTLVGDVLKGVVATALGWWLGGRTLACLCGLAAVAGHVLPVTRRLRGGRGVATGFGMAAVVLPIAAVVGIVWFYVVRAALGRPSLRSQAGIVALPIAAAVSGAAAPELIALTACAGLILAKLWSGRRATEASGVETAAPVGETPAGDGAS